jgi:hypothetical protein
MDAALAHRERPAPNLWRSIEPADRFGDGLISLDGLDRSTLRLQDLFDVHQSGAVTVVMARLAL